MGLDHSSGRSQYVLFHWGGNIHQLFGKQLAKNWRIRDFSAIFVWNTMYSVPTFDFRSPTGSALVCLGSPESEGWEQEDQLALTIYVHMYILRLANSIAHTINWVYVQIRNGMCCSSRKFGSRTLVYIDSHLTPRWVTSRRVM